ncbi:MAG: hypothetical protein SVM79_06000 [Chloroflexota bacterium]|nr:hypothetical protein [Chloroflexota bacterium]
MHKSFVRCHENCDLRDEKYRKLPFEHTETNPAFMGSRHLIRFDDLDAANVGGNP